jgi:hypothetical protein
VLLRARCCVGSRGTHFAADERFTVHVSNLGSKPGVTARLNFAAGELFGRGAKNYPRLLARLREIGALIRVGPQDLD